VPKLYVSQFVKQSFVWQLSEWRDCNFALSSIALRVAVSVGEFVWKPNWFVLAQTDGEPVPMTEIPAWDKTRALAALNITETVMTSVSWLSSVCFSSVPEQIGNTRATLLEIHPIIKFEFKQGGVFKTVGGRQAFSNSRKRGCSLRL